MARALSPAGLLYAGAGLGLLGLAWRGGYLDKALRPDATNAEDAAGWLARLILAEGGNVVVGEEEGVGIAYTALNRVRRKGFSTVQDAVTRDAGKRWFGARRTHGYCYLTETALCPGRTRGGKTVTQTSAYARAKVFAKEVLDGKHPNPIGNRTHFVHPRAFVRKHGICSTPGERFGNSRARGGMYPNPDGAWVCATPGKGVGPTYMPRWAVARSAPEGAATYEPRWVGRAVFSGLGAEPPSPEHPIYVKNVEVEPTWSQTFAQATLEGLGAGIGFLIAGWALRRTGVTK